MSQQVNTIDDLPPLTSQPASEGNGEWKVPEPDMYEFEFTRIIGTRMHQYNDESEAKPQVRLEFTIINDAEYEGVTIWRWFGWTVRPPKSTLRPFLIAMRDGVEIPDGEKIELRDYLGKRFRGTVTVDEQPSRNDPNRTVKFANIGSPIPLRRRSNAQTGADPAKSAEPSNPRNVFTEGVPA